MLAEGTLARQVTRNDSRIGRMAYLETDLVGESDWEEKKYDEEDPGAASVAGDGVGQEVWAKPSAKQASKGRATTAKKTPNRTNKGTAHACRGCRGMFDSSGMALTQNLCHACKASIDNLWHMAKRQNKLQWFSEMKSDDSKVQQLIAAYHERHPPAKPGSKRGRTANSAFNSLQYIETVEAKSAVLVDDEVR